MFIPSQGRSLRQRRLPQTVFDPFQDYRNTGKDKYCIAPTHSGTCRVSKGQLRDGRFVPGRESVLFWRFGYARLYLAAEVLSFVERWSIVFY